MTAPRDPDEPLLQAFVDLARSAIANRVVTEQRDVSARNASPIVVAMRLVLEEIAERRAAESKGE